MTETHGIDCLFDARVAEIALHRVKFNFLNKTNIQHGKHETLSPILNNINNNNNDIDNDKIDD